MKPRAPATQNVTLDESLFSSGDILFVHRPDGLATLEQVRLCPAQTCEHLWTEC
jgi:hypothetical protein